MAWKTIPEIGDRRFVAEWLVEIGGDEINGVDPDKCKYDEAVVDGDLSLALHIAAQWDLHGEGTASEQEWQGESWHTVGRYNCYGERMY